MGVVYSLDFEPPVYRVEHDWEAPRPSLSHSQSGDVDVDAAAVLPDTVSPTPCLKYPAQEAVH